jgi:hypothetical protein
MEYDEPDTKSSKTFMIDFSKFTEYPDDSSRDREYVVTGRFPNANFTILNTTVDCQGQTISFDAFEFGKFPEPVSEHPVQITC